MSDRRLEAQLRQSEERFRILFNAGYDAIFVHRADPKTGAPIGNFIEVNDTACRRLGYSREELLHLSPSDIDDPQTPTVDESSIRVAHNDGATFDRIHIAKDGRRIPVEINACMLSLDDETLMLSIARDLTERKAAEAKLEAKSAELERSNKELQQFTHVVSHDLQEPLQMVVGYLELLARKSKERLDADSEKYIRHAVDGAMRMSAMIRDLLSHSRVQAKAKESEPVSVRGEKDPSLSHALNLHRHDATSTVR